MKVERVSYPVITPSAARGILEAIFWKPEFSWHVREIAVLKPIHYFSILRNEVSSKMSPRRDTPFYADEDRTQRHTLGLKEVAYVIWADVAPRPHCVDDPAKYRNQFRRRVERGQCFHRPSLGCREFAAEFGPPGPDDRPLDGLSMDLGLMLFDLKFRGNQGPHEPRFFPAALERGVLRVPGELYREVGL
jgi:CRISPR-associated protein Cas5d